jgi:hypothetical protein
LWGASEGDNGGGPNPPDGVDHHVATFIVGNAQNGDTLNECDFLDPGNGTGIEAALMAAQNKVSAGITGYAEVYIRAGGYTIDPDAITQWPMIVPPQCTLRGAGGYTQTVLGVVPSANKPLTLFQAACQVVFRDFTLGWEAPIEAVPAATAPFIETGIGFILMQNLIFLSNTAASFPLGIPALVGSTSGFTGNIDFQNVQVLGNDDGLITEEIPFYVSGTPNQLGANDIVQMNDCKFEHIYGVAHTVNQNLITVAKVTCEQVPFAFRFNFDVNPEVLPTITGLNIYQQNQYNDNLDPVGVYYHFTGIGLSTVSAGLQLSDITYNPSVISADVNEHRAVLIECDGDGSTESSNISYGTIANVIMQPGHPSVVNDHYAVELRCLGVNGATTRLQHMQLTNILGATLLLAGADGSSTAEILRTSIVAAGASGRAAVILNGSGVQQTIMLAIQGALATMNNPGAWEQGHSFP